MIKKILIRILLLLIILVVSNYTYKYTLWPQDRSEHADLLDSLDLIQFDTDILYLSSSSNYFHPAQDTSKQWVSQYLNQFYPDLKVNAIHKGYMHAGIFLPILKSIDKDSPIKTIVLAVNQRSFGAYWIYSEVETSYSAQILTMNKQLPVLVKRFLLALDFYDNKTKEEREIQFKEAWENEHFSVLDKDFPHQNVREWDYALATSGKYKTIAGEVDQEATGFACNLVKAYAFEVDSLNPRIKDFDRIVDYCQERGFNLQLHILPEDKQRVQAMVGNDLSTIMNYSTNFIFNRYKDKAVEIIDNSNLLDSTFFYESYPTEHYTSYGKYRIAQSIAASLKKIYPDHYKNFKRKSYPYFPFTEQEVYEKTIAIKANPEWYKQIEMKAENRGLSIDSVLISDALWALKKDAQKPSDKDLQAIINKIKSNPDWYLQIQEKAKKNNIDEEAQLKKDASWILENNSK